jgi:hypothetical protein
MQSGRDCSVSSRVVWSDGEEVARSGAAKWSVSAGLVVLTAQGCNAACSTGVSQEHVASIFRVASETNRNIYGLYASSEYWRLFLQE